MTHYPRVTKKQKKQTNKQTKVLFRAQITKQTRVLLPQGNLGLYLYLYLFHYACIFNSLVICAQVLYDVLVCSIPIGYVHKFCILTLLDWCVVCAYIFNSHRIYAQILTCIGFVSAYSILS